MSLQAELLSTDLGPAESQTNISSLTGKAVMPLKAIPQGQKIAVASWQAAKLASISPLLALYKSLSQSC